MNDIDEILYAYIIEIKKKYDYYPLKGEFIIVFNDNQYRPNVASE